MEEANGWRLLLNPKVSMQPISTMQSSQWVNFHNQKSARKLFAGDVLTTNVIQSLDVIANTRVSVVGFGKVAVDGVSSAVERGSKVEHIFGTPLRLVPFRRGGGASLFVRQ
jgi:hypothetical protein